MAGYIKFRITCRRCGHVNMPNNNTRKGITQTLTGEFSKCRGCGHEWNVIGVPLRPMVEEIAHELGYVSKKVELFTYRKKHGSVPRGVAA